MSDCDKCLIRGTDICQKEAGREGQCEDYVYDIISTQKAYISGWEKGRKDVIRDHRDQCNGKCFKCDFGGFFTNLDGRDVKFPYNYSYKVGCDDERYIDIEQVSLLIDKARIETLEKIIKELNVYKSSLDPLDWLIIDNCIMYCENLKKEV